VANQLIAVRDRDAPLGQILPPLIGPMANHVLDNNQHTLRVKLLGSR